MKIIIYSICWNEEFMLPYFFKHYRNKFPDAEFVIYDNMSDDKSREIIDANGGKIVDVDSSGEFRDDINLRIKNSCWKLSDADWVIVCDVDEFVDCDEELLRTTDATIIKCEGYEMVGNTDDIDSINLGARNYYMDKAILFKPDKIKEMNYSVGCHDYSPIGNLKYASFRVPLKHMKYVNRLYVLKRYEQLNKRLSFINKQNNWGHHYSQSIDEIIATHNWLFKIADVVPFSRLNLLYYDALNKFSWIWKLFKFFKLEKPIVWKA